MPELELSGLKVGSLEMDSGTAKFDLTLCLAEGEEGWHVSLEYNTDLFEDSTAERMLARLRVLLEGIGRESGRTDRGAPAHAEEERRVLMDASNSRRVEFPHDACLHTSSNGSPPRAPAVAAVCGSESLTYGELVGERAASRTDFGRPASA